VKTITAATAVAVALAAALTACSRSPGTSTTSAGSPTSCRAQYETWKHGAAPSALKGDLKAIGSAGNARDILKLESALKAAGKDASTVKADPPPRCADPKGYYEQILAGITAAADNVRSASGLSGLMLAVAPLKNIAVIGPKLEKFRKTFARKRRVPASAS